MKKTYKYEVAENGNLIRKIDDPVNLIIEEVNNENQIIEKRRFVKLPRLNETEFKLIGWERYTYDEQGRTLTIYDLLKDEYATEYEYKTEGESTIKNEIHDTINHSISRITKPVQCTQMIRTENGDHTRTEFEINSDFGIIKVNFNPNDQKYIYVTFKNDNIKTRIAYDATNIDNIEKYKDKTIMSVYEKNGLGNFNLHKIVIDDVFNEYDRIIESNSIFTDEKVNYKNLNMINGMIFITEGKVLDIYNKRISKIKGSDFKIDKSNIGESNNKLKNKSDNIINIPIKTR